MDKSLKRLSIAFAALLMIGLCGCSKVEILSFNNTNNDDSKGKGPTKADSEKTIEEKSLEPVVAKKKVQGVKQVPVLTDNEESTRESTPSKEAHEGHDHHHDHGLEIDAKEVAKQESSKYPHFTREQKTQMVTEYCLRTQKTFDRYGWGQSSCEDFAWQFVRTSVKGDPLLWRTYGEPATDDEHTETTLIMCGVHGDEITPIKFCYDVLNYMEKISQGKVIDPHTNKVASLKGKLVIIAPLVNPDSYFKKRPTRTNANGVDVNRNFPTHDFKKYAMNSWIKRYGRDKRRFPGKQAMSEPETIFQVNLIYRYKPDKIISVHAPLTMLDYDGPASAHTGGIVGSRANQLLIRMSEQAKGYRIKNYPFFPGSLGNYAGNERNIPTFTLELPTSDASKASSYWSLFKESIHSAIMHEIKGEGFVALDQEQNPYQKKKQSNN